MVPASEGLAKAGPLARSAPPPRLNPLSREALLRPGLDGGSLSRQLQLLESVTAESRGLRASRLFRSELAGDIFSRALLEGGRSRGDAMPREGGMVAPSVTGGLLSRQLLQAGSSASDVLRSLNASLDASSLGRSEKFGAFNLCVRGLGGAVSWRFDAQGSCFVSSVKDEALRQAGIHPGMRLLRIGNTDVKDLPEAEVRKVWKTLRGGQVDVVLAPAQQQLPAIEIPTSGLTPELGLVAAGRLFQKTGELHVFRHAHEPQRNEVIQGVSGPATATDASIANVGVRTTSAQAEDGEPDEIKEGEECKDDEDAKDDDDGKEGEEEDDEADEDEPEVSDKEGDHIDDEDEDDDDEEEAFPFDTSDRGFEAFQAARVRELQPIGLHPREALQIAVDDWVALSPADRSRWDPQASAALAAISAALAAVPPAPRQLQTSSVRVSSTSTVPPPLGTIARASSNSRGGLSESSQSGGSSLQNGEVQAGASSSQNAGAQSGASHCSSGLQLRPLDLPCDLAENNSALGSQDPAASSHAARPFTPMVTSLAGLARSPGSTLSPSERDSDVNEEAAASQKRRRLSVEPVAR